MNVPTVIIMIVVILALAAYLGLRVASQFM
jgi:hypothetical protein